MPPMPKSKNLYIGIDPGMGGGIAWISGSSKGAIPMPKTERDIWDVINCLPADYDYVQAVIEKVHSMPGQGVASTFKFGQNLGLLRGFLIASEMSFDEVTPQAWIRYLEIPSRNKSETGTQWKNRLKAKAQQYWPQFKITLATSDAILLATYCQRKYRNSLG